MQLGLINSAWVGTAVDPIRGIELTKEIGFDTIDIFADPLEIKPQDWRAIREECRRNDLPVVSVVCCALGIADFNRTVRDFHIHRAERYLDFGYDLRASNLLLVLGEYIWNQEVIPPADQWNWAVESVRDLAGYAEDLGLDIAVELEPFSLSIVNTIDKMDQFLNEVGNARVKANVDISHLLLANNDPGEIGKLKGRIAHVHLSDCDGRRHGDLPPGRGVVNFPPYLKALADAGFDGTVSIELEYSPEPARIVDWVREAYTSTDRLMSEQSLRKQGGKAHGIGSNS